MARYRIQVDVIVYAKSRKKAEKLETRMLDAVADQAISVVAAPIEEVDDADE